MNELSSIKGCSYADWQEYQLYCVLGCPDKSQFIGTSRDKYPIMQKHTSMFLEKWGVE